MKPRFIYIHGNGSMGWDFAWAPWLQAELQQLGFETTFKTFPDSIIARSKYWLPFLRDYLKADEKSVLIGWSTGAIAAMRYAESNKIGGSILVSAYHTDLGKKSERESGYFDAPWDWEAIRANQPKICVIHSDNDPYIPQAEFDHVVEQLRSERIVVNGAGHFIDQEKFPELLDYIKKTYR